MWAIVDVMFCKQFLNLCIHIKETEWKKMKQNKEIKNCLTLNIP